MRSSFLSGRSVRIVAAALLALIGPGVAMGVGLTYVDGDPEFSSNVGPLSAFAAANSGTDNFWGKRTDFGASSIVWESAAAEDSPEIVQTITGLTPGNSYDVYGVFWSDNDENWAMRAGTATNTYTTYTYAGVNGAFPQVDSVQGAPAALAEWDPAGLPLLGPGAQIFTQRGTSPFAPATFLSDDPLVMLLGKAGTQVADGSGNIAVYMNDLGGAPGARRAWFDGVAYRPATAGSLTPTATLNRDTGTLTITNGTSIARQIKAIRVESTLSGSLDAVTWTAVHESDANWTAFEPAAPASTPYANNLVETGSTNITLAANGGTLNFGQVWNKSPFDHQISIHLMLSDDTLAILTPAITGAAAILGDFDGNDNVDLADYQVLLGSIHTNVAGVAPTVVQRYQLGDINNDTVVNFSDFQAFRVAFDAHNGAGAFVAMLASVPEPSSLVLALGMFALVWKGKRSRTFAGCLALAIGVLLGSNARTALAVNIKVDIDSTRTGGGTTTGGPPFTQAGFTSWDMTTFPVTGASTSVDGITFTLTGGTSGNNAGFAGANQSRIRLTGTAPNQVPNGGAGPQNNVLGDFIYNEGADGREIVLDIAGLPVGNYLMYSWHQDLGVAVGDATTVIVADTGGGNAQTMATGVPFSATPISYFFEVTNASVGKRVTFRETSSTNRSRLNAFSIETPIELTLKVYTLNGQMEIVNEQGVNFDMNYYEIRSTAGSLETATWSSFDDGEAGGGNAADFNQNGAVDAADYVVWRRTNGPGANYTLWKSQFGNAGGGGDPIGTGWDEVPGSTQNILSELNLQSMSTLTPAQVKSLGAAFELGGVRDLQFYYAGPNDSTLRRGIVKFITSGSGSALGSGSVPEPTSFVLLALAVSLAFGPRRSR
jgi:hypothetical protein